MCGICGFLGQSIVEPVEVVREMSNVMTHRGPDDSGYWADYETGVFLSHRRLSILDLSRAGHQPMQSGSGRYIIVFNGEIYNHAALRRDIDQVANVAWRGHSDTEVILAAIDIWGAESAITRFVGMFAIALWDRHKRKLYLVRDRVGEKPLYYGWVGTSFLFASELKCMKQFPTWRGAVDRNALTLFLRHNYIPAPYTIYQGINKLLPGNMLVLSLDSSDSKAGEAHLNPYWSAKEIAENAFNTQFNGTEDDAILQLDKLLRESVYQQMEADVPLGAFLSGGIDSSAIVALMQAQSNRSVKTFTIGFHDQAYNEADHAKAVAHHLGTEHTEFYIEPKDVLSVIPRLATLYDEPFADSSQIPTYLIAKLTSEHVKVSLSGDGGDELFCGYGMYSLTSNIWRRIGWMPNYLKQLIAQIIGSFTPESWNYIFNQLNSVLSCKANNMLLGDKLYKFIDILHTSDQLELYHALISHWKKPGQIVLNGQEPQTLFTNAGKRINTGDCIKQMMYLDFVSYLPDDILVKVDRAAMACSLETRIPFLDHRVVEFAWQLPNSLKMRGTQNKWLLRQVLYKYVPRKLIDRPKTGFSLPLDMLLRGPLRDWAEALLDTTRLHNEAFFDPLPIRQKWAEHLSGQRNWQYYLWDILMFQEWLEHNQVC